jgi:hypothetical protein
MANWEMFLQELSEAPPPRVPGATLPELVLFVRRWNPSDLVLGPFQEIELNSMQGEELRNKVKYFLMCLISLSDHWCHLELLYAPYIYFFFKSLFVLLDVIIK